MTKKKKRISGISNNPRYFKQVQNIVSRKWSNNLNSDTIDLVKGEKRKINQVNMRKLLVKVKSIRRTISLYQFFMQMIIFFSIRKEI